MWWHKPVQKKPFRPTKISSVSVRYIYLFYRDFSSLFVTINWNWVIWYFSVWPSHSVNKYTVYLLLHLYLATYFFNAFLTTSFLLFSLPFSFLFFLIVYFPLVLDFHLLVSNTCTMVCLSLSYAWIFVDYLTMMRVKSYLTVLLSSLHILLQAADKKEKNPVVMTTIGRIFKKLVHLVMLLFYVSDTVTLSSELHQCLVFIVSVPWLFNVSRTTSTWTFLTSYLNIIIITTT